MPTKKRPLALAVFLALGAFLMAAAFNLKAATIEVESDDEDLNASPTPATSDISAHPGASPSNPSGSTATSTPIPASPALTPLLEKSKPIPGTTPADGTPTPAKAAPVSAILEKSAPVPSPHAIAAKRVRVSDNVGFYYFVKAGYTADSSTLSSIGKVAPNGEFNNSYTPPEKPFVDIDPSAASVSLGDLLVVFRADRPISESHTGSLGVQVENLAIVKIVDIHDRRCQVEILKGFKSFRKGDLVASYDREIGRWKQAQIKKPLPTNAVKCYVAGGEEGQSGYNQLDYIYLSAGTKDGVVEGQTFQLWDNQDLGLQSDIVHKPRGLAQVIYAGPTCSTARILTNGEIIECGFEAQYLPSN